MRTKHVVASAIVAVTVGLAGCSSSSSSSSTTTTASPVINSSMTPGQVVNASAKALSDQQIMALKGYLTASGFNGNVSITINRSKDFSMAMATGAASLASPSVQIVHTGGKTYVNLAQAFVLQYIPKDSKLPATVNNAIASALANKWLIVPTSGALSGVAQFSSLTNDLNIEKLSSQLKQVPTGATVGSQTTVNGVTAIPVSAQGTTFYMDVNTALPVRISQSGTQNNLDVSYPTSTTIGAPSGAVTFQAALGPALAAAFAAGFASGLG